MTKNRARKRATQALTKAADIRRPEAAYQADHRKLRTPNWGVIDFAEGPLRLLGTEDALNHYRPLEVVLQAAREKRWRIVQLTTLDTRTLRDMFAYLRAQPTLTILLTAKGTPVNPVAAELLSGKHKDLNVAIQDDTTAQAMHELIPGRIITFDIEDGADLEPIPPRITEWHAMVNQGGAVHGPINTIEWEPKDSPEVLCSAPAPTEFADDFAAAVNRAMREKPDAFILNESNYDSPVQLEPGVTGSGMTDALMRSLDEAPISLITGAPGTGRTAQGWARVNAADAELDALGVPRAAREFVTYPDGLFLITGTTGQGKTTAALALLRRALVDRPRKAYAIMTPHEASFAGAAGAEVLTAEDREGEVAAAIRNAVASGADVLLVDDLRAPDAAEAALTAALSGVLVFAGMHISASGASDRLLDMLPVAGADEDVDAKLRENQARVEQGLRGVFEQRLMRGEGKGGRVLVGEVWVKDEDADQPILAPVLTMKDSYAALVAEGTIL